MKLKQVRVRMFRNILDSTVVSIQPDITCLVGKNESGKTAFLQALWRIKPARTKQEFSIPDQYPAWLEKRHRNEGKDLARVQPAEAVFTWEDSDVMVVDERFGAGVAPRGGEFVVSRRYDNRLLSVHGCSESKAVQNLLATEKLPPAIARSLRQEEAFGPLTKRLQDLILDQKTNTEFKDVTTKLGELLKRANGLLGGKTFDDVLWTVIEPRIPSFLYFADYSRLPYSVKISSVLRASDDLKESEATARSLLRLGGAENDYLLNPDYERRKRELENVANALTEDVLRYWSQNQGLRVQPEITQTTEQRPNGQHSVLDELKIRIWDSRHSLSLPFDQHSAGFQWFFSFLAAFSEYEHQNPPVIILLDEPAVGLHAKAQADFLRFIEERLSARCQVIYTTHSPFMVQPGHLERVRIVEDRGKEEGSIVSSDVLSRDPDTLFPLQGALGYDLVQNLFVAKHNLVVEGTADYTYLLLVSDYLATMANRICLDPRWSIVPVGGADAVPTFVALLGSHLDVTVLLDSRKEGHQRLYRLASDGYLSRQRIILIGDVITRSLADIEDLFEIEEYLAIYNMAFGTSLTEVQLTSAGPIVARITRHLGTDRYDHGKPADVLLRERDKILPGLSQDTLRRFENLFDRINKTI